MENVKFNRGEANICSCLSPSERKWELVNFCEFDKYATKSYCAIHNVDESKNLGDITKVDEDELGDFNMICGGSPCFVAGTKVYTSTGYKNIEDVKIGDMVLTHKNRYMPVVNIGGENNKEIYSMKIQGFLELQCTDYHPFYCKKSKTSNVEKIILKDINNGYYLGSHINTKEENEYNLSNEDCWILGRYVADGHIRKSKRKGRIDSYQYQCILSIGNNKVEKLKSIVKKRHYSCYKHTKSTYRIVFSSMKLVNFIINHNFGNGAENKIIPNFILDLPVDKLKWFLNGYMDGDGCEINGVHQATTVSKQLAMGLSLIIQKVYRIGCCIYYNKRPDIHIIEGRTVKQKDTYTVRFRTNDCKHLWFIEDDIVWYPVKEIKNTNRVENVFNIEVEEDHTYTANNIITFNCQDFSISGKQKGSVWTCKECGHEYNPLTVHWSKRGKCPICDSSNVEKTRSSLLVEYLRVVRAKMPNFGIYENVKNIVGKQFKETFEMFTSELEEYGYNVYYEVLNAKNYGIPQNRERVYLVFVRKDLDNKQFKFPEPFDNGLRLKDFLEDEVDEKFYISDEKVKRFIANLNTDITDKTDECSPKFIGNVNREDFGTGYTGGVWDDSYVSPTLTTMQGGGRQPHIITGLVKNKGEEFTKKTNYANTLLARDYKGFGNQEMNCVIENGKIAIPQATKKGYIECEIGGVADLSYPDSKTRRGRVQEGGNISPTITATETGVCRIESVKNENSEITLENIRIRKLTPRECFRLMGFSDEAFDAAQTAGISNSQLYKQAGNSIVTDVLYYIYIELYKAMPYLFDNLELSSFFSGIGAFECALNRLYQDINSGKLIKKIRRISL